MRIWFAPVAIVAFGISTSYLAISEVRYELQLRANHARLIYSFKALEAKSEDATFSAKCNRYLDHILHRNWI